MPAREDQLKIPTWFQSSLLSGIGVIIVGGFLSWVDLTNRLAVHQEINSRQDSEISKLQEAHEKLREEDKEIWSHIRIGKTVGRIFTIGPSEKSGG